MSAHVERIRENGYTILEAALSAKSRARIRAELTPWLNGEHPGRNDFEGFRTERVYAMLAKSPASAELVEHRDILAIADALLQPNYLLSALLAINIHPGETPQSWHIDDAAGSLGHHAFARPRAALGLSTIWALDDFTSTNGATEIVPGSHRWPDGREPVAGESVQALMPAGAVIVFAGNLVHRGGANLSNAPRLAITSQYCMPWLRQTENMPLAVPPAIARQYSQRVQLLLGYSVVEPGFVGHVNGRHPRLLVDPAHQGRRHRV